MKIKIVITGIQNYINIHELDANQDVILKKDYENKYDNEAIAVYLNDSIKIGYIANSVYTVYKGTYSAGHLYDKIIDSINAKILVVGNKDAIGEVNIGE